MRSRSQIAIFLSVLIVLLFTANSVVFEAFTLAFGITSIPGLVATGAILGILAVGFICMMIFGVNYYNLLTRTLFTALSTWLGAFANFFFASVLYGLVVGASLLLDISLPFQLLGQSLFVAGVIVSIYGVMHARRIIPAHYNVRLPNLPSEWIGKKAAWISDIHLGQIYGPSFAAKVTKEVLALEPDIVFVGGDLYDGTQAPDPNMLAAPFKELKAPWGVYYITGNHEEYGKDVNIFLNAIRGLGMHILADEKADVHGLQLLGVDYHNTNTPDGFAKILESLEIDRNKPSILLKHEPNHLPIAEKAGVSLKISGHTHHGQQWPFGYLAQLSYKGFAYGLKPHGAMQMLTSSGIGTWGPPLRIGTNAEIAVITFA